MDKVVLTGASGFIGKWLIRLLNENQYDVTCFSRDQVDLLEKESLESFIEIIKPKIVFHLASQSSPFISWQQPYETLKSNILSSLNMLELSEKYGFKLVIPGSAEVYETNENAIAETSTLNPRNPYGVSKLTIDYLVRQVAINRQINVTLLRLFNSIGPEQNESFVVSSFAKQLALIKLGKQEPVIYVGNLEASRDFVDVRDAVRAMYMVAHSEEYGEYYNVCSGKAYKIYDILKLLISISELKVEVVNDPDRMRPSDIHIFVGDYSKINDKYKWAPSIPLEQTLKDTYLYWLSILK